MSATRAPRGRRRAVLAALAALLALALAGPAAARAEAPPHINHLFVIVLENENAENTFGPVPPSPYLGTTMREAGAFIPNYYGIGHQSLDNYIALVSGQPPNLATQADCLIYTEMAATSVPENGVAVGQGCVFPRSVPTIGNQLERSGGTWRSYAQDMAAGAALGEATTCRHPTLGNYDTTQTASATNQYAARHVPFVYFHAVTDYETCNRNVVDLNELPATWRAPRRRPSTASSRPTSAPTATTRPAPTAPRRPASPGSTPSCANGCRGSRPRRPTRTTARSSSPSTSPRPAPNPAATSRSAPTPSTTAARSPATAAAASAPSLLSPCVKPGTVTQTAYNHFSTLLWTEKNFGLAPLGDANTEGLSSFGTDVFSNPACTTGLPAAAGAENATRAGARIAPTRATAPAPGRQAPDLPLPPDEHRGWPAQAGATIRFGGRKATTNAAGRAHLKLRLRHPGKRVAVAKAPGCPPTKAPIHAKRPRHH